MADVQIDQDAANIAAVNLVNGSTDPSAPGSGHGKVYLKDGVLLTRLDTGDPTAVGGAVALPEGQLAVGDASGVASALALGTPGDVVTADASGFAAWATPAAPVAGGSSRVDLFGPAYSATTGGGTVSILSTSTHPLYTYVQLSAPVLDAEIAWQADLAAGTWALRAFGGKANVGGIGHLLFNGVEKATLDFYNGTSVWGQVWSATGIVVAASGLIPITLKMSSKNGSSTGYALWLSMISLWRTA